MGILKCDSSSQPRTNCGIAQYNAKGSKRLTWLEMKKLVFCGSNPGERTTLIFAPEKNMMRRQKVRCSQSCFLGSRKMASTIRIGTAMAKCKRLTIQRNALRKTYQARFICKCPRRTAGCREICIRAKRFRRRLIRRPDLES